MSDDIYDDVIKTESNGMEGERVERMVVIYESADSVKYHDFETETNTNQQLQHAGSDSVRIRSFRASTVCLGLLCVLLLTAVIVLSVYIYTNSTNSTQETQELLTKISNLTEERDKLLKREAIVLRDQLRNHLLDGWTYYGSSFYYMSNETRNWVESRRDCKNRRADLVIINNREEQHFVMNITHNQEFWIGLTDSDVEDKWKWVDGTEMTSGFWASSGSISEPNGKTEENCVVTHLKKHPELVGWLDVSCNDAYQWICEMSIVPFT